jgi:hypothetical protein
MNGYLFLTCFGTVWLVLGCFVAPLGRKLRWLPLSLLVIIAIALIYRGFTPNAYSTSAGGAAAWARIKGPFIAINVAQYFAIFLIVALAIRKNRRDLIYPLISATVGIHFLALAPIFTFPAYYLTGGLILCADGVSFIIGISYRRAFVCLVTGIILWGTALLTLGRL